MNFLLSAQKLIAKNVAPGCDSEVTYTTGDRQPLTTLRSGGLGLSRHGRSGQAAMMAALAALNNAHIERHGQSPQPFVAGEPQRAGATGLTPYAEDVLRGYRIDVVRHRRRTLGAR